MPQENINIAQGPTPAYAGGLVSYGAGEPGFTAPKGSLYLRSDGSDTSTRAYINSDGADSWVAVTTAS